MVKFIIEVSDEWFGKNATVESALNNAEGISPKRALVNMISKAYMERQYKEGTREFVINNEDCPEALADTFSSLCEMFFGLHTASDKRDE